MPCPSVRDVEKNKPPKISQNPKQLLTRISKTRQLVQVHPNNAYITFTMSKSTRHTALPSVNDRVVIRGAKSGRVL
jgi:hypothetical protein